MRLAAIINLDDITHIESLEKAVGYIPKVISCRYNPGGVFKISNDIMDNPGDAKYGMTTEQIFEAFKILKAKGAEEFGIHSFLASNTVTNDYYPMLAKELFELAVKLQKGNRCSCEIYQSFRWCGNSLQTGSGHRMISVRLAKVCVRFMKKFLFRQEWEMWQSTQRWAVL